MTRSPALTSSVCAGAANTVAASAAKAKVRGNLFIRLPLLFASARHLERILPRQDKGPPREGMEQEVLLIEQIIYPEIEREIPGGVVMDLHVHHEEVIEGTEDMRNAVGVIKGR